MRLIASIGCQVYLSVQNEINLQIDLINHPIS